ncbi:MAG: Bro-N domain-containing protein [Patescibacteria group bacterium]
MKGSITVFEDQNIRRVYDEKSEKWFFAVIDVVSVLTGSPRPRKYWNALKTKLKTEGSEVSQKLGQLKMIADDGKKRLTDTADTELLFRIIQSIPSPKAEPFKLWLAKIGHERVQEIADPERSVNRARENWLKHGRGEEWIQRRMMGQEIRNKLTDYWNSHEIKKGEEYAVLTNLIHEEWSGVSEKGHKQMKGLKTQNLRDHMTEAELVFTALAEMSTRQIAESMTATGLTENKVAGKKGGGVAKNARLELEEKTKKKVVSGKNYLLK